VALTLDTAFQIALSLIAALGGMWLRNLQTDIKELAHAVQAVRDQYQRRDDAHRDSGQILRMLEDMNRSIERIDQKLDRKADKDKQ